MSSKDGLQGGADIEMSVKDPSTGIQETIPEDDSLQSLTPEEDRRLLRKIDALFVE
jgi:hypothetical protein